GGDHLRLIAVAPGHGDGPVGATEDGSQRVDVHVVILAVIEAAQEDAVAIECSARERAVGGGGGATEVVQIPGHHREVPAGIGELVGHVLLGGGVPGAVRLPLHSHRAGGAGAVGESGGHAHVGVGVVPVHDWHDAGG